MAFGVSNRVQDPTDWVRVDTAYGESYTSASLNKKLAGILPTGVYWGFEVVPASGMQVKVCPGPEYPKNVAVAERNGYSLTGTSEGELLVPVPAGFRGLLVLDMDYDHQLTRSAVRLVETASECHIVLAGLNVPVGAQAILPGHISYVPRQEGSPTLLAAQIARQAVAMERHGFDFADLTRQVEQSTQKSSDAEQRSREASAHMAEQEGNSELLAAQTAQQGVAIERVKFDIAELGREASREREERRAADRDLSAYQERQFRQAAEGIASLNRDSELLAAQIARGAVAAERRSLEFSGRLAWLEQN